LEPPIYSYPRVLFHQWTDYQEARIGSNNDTENEEEKKTQHAQRNATQGGLFIFDECMMDAYDDVLLTTIVLCVIIINNTK
jgi:hypothetical protein